MYIKKGIYINWGNIPQLEFEFGPINLFSGGNGSGKTTAADGIQTLMTAAHENLFNYNPGQDETTQRGRGGKQVRTLASYVLGCDDGSYSRLNTTDGYIAATFHPTAGEPGEKFTAIMGMRAHIDAAGNSRQARLDQLVFFVLPGVELTIEHFVRLYPAGGKNERHVVPINDIGGFLQQEFGKKTVEVYDKKGTYLRRLYGALRGKKDAVSDRESKHAARTFSNFMAYKPVKSINDFVAGEILEKKDLGEAIRTVSDLMKTIHGMEEDARHILNSIEILAKADGLSKDYVEHWIQRALVSYQEALRIFKLQQKTYVSGKQQQKQLTESIKEKETRLDVNRQRREETLRSMVDMEAKRQGVAVLNEKDDLEKRIARLQTSLSEKAAPLLEHDHQLKQNVKYTQRLINALNETSWATYIPALEDKALRSMAKKIMAERENASVDLHRFLAKDWVDISPLEQHLDNAAAVEAIHNQWAAMWHERQGDKTDIRNSSSLRDQVIQLKSDFERQLQAKQKQIQQKDKEIHQLESHQVTYPPYVEIALLAIEQQCPQAEPRVLCDYIQVLDSQWQMAIEGYMGGARFSIIVKEEYEAQAIRVVRNLPGGRSRARVIQGARAKRDAERINLPSESMVSLMSFEHKTVEHYVTASYGQVVTVPDAETLRSTARGITREGMASGSYSLWRCDIADGDLVFGHSAREKAMAAKQQEYSQFLEASQQLNDDVKAANDLFDLINGIGSIEYARVMQEMVDINRQLKRAEQSLEQLDLSDFTALEKQLEDMRQQFSNLEVELKQLENEKGRDEEALSSVVKSLQALADQQDKSADDMDHQEMLVRQITKVQPRFDVDAALVKAEETLVLNDQNFYKDESSALTNRLTKVAGEITDVIMQHNQHCSPADTIAYDPDFNALHQPNFFKRISQLQAEVDNIHNRLQNNVLVEKHDQLATLKDRFNETFVSHLCHSIYQAINEGERALEAINRELEHHRFGTDQERFYFEWEWVPEFYDYWRFFKEVTKIPNLGEAESLFDIQLPKAVQGVREKLVNMLLDDDEQIAFRELNRIADYRLYRRYDIFKEPLGKAPIPLSQYGTGSGGQLETPAYIIRSAAVTSAFRFNEGQTHLRMVLVDEAFSKMDETRSREVIHYLTDTLGLQLVFIMPTSKSGPFMDLISNQFVFSKCPTSSPAPGSELNTRVIVDRKKCDAEKIKNLWQQHRASIRDQAVLDFMEDIV
ncbi:MAG: AAA family ATPase [Pseudomonadales bacterium]|nr:AAA family ATPase [Pseudomonadales bacterium]